MPIYCRLEEHSMIELAGYLRSEWYVLEELDGMDHIVRVLTFIKNDSMPSNRENRSCWLLEVVLFSPYGRNRVERCNDNIVLPQGIQFLSIITVENIYFQIISCNMPNR